MEVGNIIQNYQGKYAKVVAIKGTRFGLSAWVAKESEAKEATKAVRYLNSYGISQVTGETKESKKGAKAKVNTLPSNPTTEDSSPDFEQMTAAQLKDIAKDLGLKTSGTKAELVQLITDRQEAAKQGAS